MIDSWFDSRFAIEIGFSWFDSILYKILYLLYYVKYRVICTYSGLTCLHQLYGNRDHQNTNQGGLQLYPGVFKYGYQHQWIQTKVSLLRIWSIVRGLQSIGFGLSHLLVGRSWLMAVSSSRLLKKRIRSIVLLAYLWYGCIFGSTIAHSNWSLTFQFYFIDEVLNHFFKASDIFSFICPCFKNSSISIISSKVK